MTLLLKVKLEWEGCGRQRFSNLKRILSIIEGLQPLSRATTFRYWISEMNKIRSEQIVKAQLIKVQNAAIY